MREISNGRKKDLDWIKGILGKPYGFWENIKLRGVGSPPLKYHSGNVYLDTAKLKVNSADYCNLQLYPTGILFRMNVNTQVYAIPIPFSQLGSMQIQEQADKYWPYHLSIEVRDHNTLKFRIKKDRVNTLISFLTKKQFAGRFALHRL